MSESIQGMGRLLRKLDVLGTELEADSDIVEESLWDGGAVLVNGAGRRSRRDTGAMADTVHRTSDKRSEYDEAVATASRLRPEVEDLTGQATAQPGQVVVSTLMPYSAPNEFGTSKLAAQPFIRPAADEDGQRAIDTVQAGVRKRLDGKLK